MTQGVLCVLGSSRRELLLFQLYGSEFNPINTASISVIPIAHSFTLLHDTFDWSTDAKSKLKFGVVSVTMEQHTEGWLQDSQSMLDRCVA